MRALCYDIGIIGFAFEYVIKKRKLHQQIVAFIYVGI